MDDRRFDCLARSFGAGTTRRRGLRLLAGAAGALLAFARGREAAAHHGWVPLGGACYQDEQCDQSAVAYPYQAICANNGFDYDGPYNCCVTSDARCQIDEHCCWAQACVAGYCTDLTVGALGLGEQCGAPEQCYSGSGTETTCADNGIDPGGICCTFYGFGCITNRHCCGSLICQNGACTVPYEGFG